MIGIMKREIRNYMKQPLFWLGILILLLGVFQDLEPYLRIHYIQQEEKQQEGLPQYSIDGDIAEGYIPAKEEERRSLWNQEIGKLLVREFQMDEKEAQGVLAEMKDMEIQEACAYLKNTYHFYGANYTYEDTAYHLGTREEVNAYLEEKLEDRPFSWYFSRKFADFAGLYMGFFASLILALLFYQDTRKNTYQLLHTKPLSGTGYILGKAAGGFGVCLIALGMLNLCFWAACKIFTRASGFEVRLMDFLGATALYILPNMLMIVGIYSFVSLAFKNPLPAVPLLILYMIYSNMGSRSEEGIYGYYGRPLAIMVRFPGQFFETAPPPMVLLNQCFLILAALGMLALSIQLWRRRRL